MAKITRKELIDELVRLSKNLEKSPTKSDMDEHGTYSYGPYYREFEGWNHALEEAGMGLNKSSKLSRNELIQELVRVGDIVDGPPTKEEMENIGKYSGSVYTRRFESWNRALTHANYEPNCRFNIPTQDLLQELRRLVRDIDRSPTGADMDEKGAYSTSIYCDRFGSWNESLAKVGAEPHTRRDIPTSELLDELNSLAKELGHPPTATEMNSMGKFSERPYASQFGSWNSAISEAGLDLENEYGVSNEDLIVEMSRVSEVIEDTPRVDDMREFGKYSSGTYEGRFGSWNDALIEAGLSPTKPTNISDDELVEEIRRLADEVGEQPKYDVMAELGRYSTTIYEQRFGSWNDALIEAGFEPREPLSGPDHPHWNGGGRRLYRKLRLSYGTRTWGMVRENVVERDGNVCQFQGCGSETLAVHHIVPVLAGGTNSEDTLLSLCPHHHKVAEIYTKENIIRPVIADIVEDERRNDISVSTSPDETMEQTTLHEYS